MYPEYKVFCNREGAVGNKFPPWHATLQRHAVHNARSNDHIGSSINDGTNEFRNKPRIVLMVGMKHDDDVRSMLQCFQIAGLLISAVTAVLDMNDDREAERVCDVHRLVLTDII